MQQFKDYGDSRNKGFCVHCGTSTGETRDHTPSKAFLDDPLPTNLPITFACGSCNNGFSLDEQYVACLVECVVTGSVDPEKIVRSKVASALRKDVKLAAMLGAARQETDDGSIVWQAMHDRVRKVIVKLARGHVAFEINEPQLSEPDDYWVKPLHLMSAGEREEFESDADTGMLVGWPEVGSRAMQRIMVVGDAAYTEGPWLNVQDDRYRYRVDQGDGNRVRIVIREYLACSVAWS